MEIIEATPRDEFEDICDAGDELLNELYAVLNRRGLSIEHAPNVLVIAAGGVMVGSGFPSEYLAEGSTTAMQLWRSEQLADGSTRIVFDPPHRRPEVIAARKDNEN